MEKDSYVPMNPVDSLEYVANSTDDDEGGGLGGLQMMDAAGATAVAPPPPQTPAGGAAASGESQTQAYGAAASGESQTQAYGADDRVDETLSQPQPQPEPLPQRVTRQQRKTAAEAQRKDAVDQAAEIERTASRELPSLTAEKLKAQDAEAMDKTPVAKGKARGGRGNGKEPKATEEPKDKAPVAGGMAKGGRKQPKHDQDAGGMAKGGRKQPKDDQDAGGMAKGGRANGKEPMEPEPEAEVAKSRSGRALNQSQFTRANLGPARQPLESGSATAVPTPKKRARSRLPRARLPEMPDRNPDDLTVARVHDNSRQFRIAAQMSMLEHVERTPEGDDRALFGVRSAQDMSEEFLTNQMRYMSRLLHPDKIIHPRYADIPAGLVDRYRAAQVRMIGSYDALRAQLDPFANRINFSSDEGDEDDDGGNSSDGGYGGGAGGAGGAGGSRVRSMSPEASGAAAGGSRGLAGARMRSPSAAPAGAAGASGSDVVLDAAQIDAALDAAATAAAAHKAKCDDYQARLVAARIAATMEAHEKIKAAKEAKEAAQAAKDAEVVAALAAVEAEEAVKAAAAKAAAEKADAADAVARDKEAKAADAPDDYSAAEAAFAAREAARKAYNEQRRLARQENTGKRKKFDPWGPKKRRKPNPEAQKKKAQKLADKRAKQHRLNRQHFFAGKDAMSFKDYWRMLTPDQQKAQWKLWEKETIAFIEKGKELDKAVKAARGAEEWNAARAAVRQNKLNHDLHVLVTNYATGGEAWLTPTHRYAIRRYWRLVNSGDPYWVGLDQAQSDKSESESESGTGSEGSDTDGE